MLFLLLHLAAFFPSYTLLTCHLSIKASLTPHQSSLGSFIPFLYSLHERKKHACAHTHAHTNKIKDRLGQFGLEMVKPFEVMERMSQGWWQWMSVGLGACLWSSTEISWWSESIDNRVWLWEWDVAHGLKPGREWLTWRRRHWRLTCRGCLSRQNCCQFCLQDNSEGQEGVALSPVLWICSRFTNSVKGPYVTFRCVLFGYT